MVGCSSSEIAAHAIGCYSSKEVGEAYLNALYKGNEKRERPLPGRPVVLRAIAPRHY